MAPSRDNAFYVTSYCNFAHRLRDGKPIGHECLIIPPKALAAERAGDTDEAIRILQTASRRYSRGIKG